MPPPNAFFAVYGGHGGSSAAQHLKSRLHLLLAADMRLWRESPRDALLNAFALSESELRQMYDHQPEDTSGSCACVGLLRGRRLLVASVGDCRLLLLRAEGSSESYVQLTTDHRATESSEQKRILRAGGQITDGRVWGALMPSRTLGDFPYKDKGPGLSAEPEIFEYEVTPEDKCASPATPPGLAMRYRLQPLTPRSAPVSSVSRRAQVPCDGFGWSLRRALEQGYRACGM